MKTRYMIVEDEAVSARSLERMIAMMRPEYEAVYKAKSVSEHAPTMATLPAEETMPEG